jgi:hypothetical protein
MAALNPDPPPPARARRVVGAPQPDPGAAAGRRWTCPVEAAR